MNLSVSTAPHIRSACTTKRIMTDVLISLVPTVIAAIVFFGWQALVIVVIALVSAFLSEFIYYTLANRKHGRVISAFFEQFDYTSLVTAVLLAACLPASIEGWYLPLLGSIFAVCVVKMPFGGTGKNLVNPAICGRIFLFISFAEMLNYPLCNLSPLLSLGGAVTGATAISGGVVLSPVDLFLGTGLSGCLGETCKLALLAGGAYLCLRRVIKWYLPLLTIASCGLVTVLLNGVQFSGFLPSVLSGGLILSAIFMATDYVTTPKTRLGNVIYFMLLGGLTAILRYATGVEVVSFCILLMNLTVPLFDLIIPVHPFGFSRKRRNKA